MTYWLHLYLLAIFVFLWASDTGAYCVGSLIGKHPLFKRISPNKSWEGSVGGAVLAIGISMIFAQRYKPLFYLAMGWNGSGGGCVRHMGRPCGIADEAPAGHKGFGQHSSGARRNARPFRQFAHCHSGSCAVSYNMRILFQIMITKLRLASVNARRSSLFTTFVWQKKRFDIQYLQYIRRMKRK